jgi:hypothetical protein
MGCENETGRQVPGREWRTPEARLKRLPTVNVRLAAPRSRILAFHASQLGRRLPGQKQLVTKGFSAFSSNNFAKVEVAIFVIGRGSA